MSDVKDNRSVKYIGLLLAVFLIFATLLFKTQSEKFGFEPGHYGWVSSHVLAQVKKSTPENGLLGYTYKAITAESGENYYYFDRYPIFFSALLNSFLSFFSDNYKSEILAARYFMNCIYLITFILAYFIAQTFFKNTIISLTTILLVFSGHDLLYYKDMIHFDQPALLGMCLLILAISRFPSLKKTQYIYAAALFAVSLGRGYMSFAVLALWCGYDFFCNFREKKEIPSFFKRVSFKTTLACFFFSFLMLAYNVTQEAKIRNVPVQETSIIISAKNRLGLSPIGSELEKKAALHRVFAKQFNRISRNLIPRVFVGSSSLDDIEKPLRGILISLQYILLIISAFFLKRFYTTFEDKNPLLICLGSGWLWCLVMKKLTAFHDYTSMTYLPLLILLVGSTIYSINKKYPKTAPILLVFALFVSLSSLYFTKHYHDKTLEPYNSATLEIQKIKELLAKESVYAIGTLGLHTTYFKNAPYAMAYYLGDYFFDNSLNQRFTISKEPISEASNLTPENKYFYLFESR